MLVIKGTAALMGSGELTGSMVETHKRLLARCRSRGEAVFLDTPAGFQENVDLISERAVEYFQDRVKNSLKVASVKSAAQAAGPLADRALSLLGSAGYVLIGPGSPTYTVNQLKETAIPDLLTAMVAAGGCFVAASAAALTAGSHTLPVYEIYKVGEQLRWAEGLNILGRLGLDLVVIPHWNNTEGGNHDTRFCYMGERRFLALEKMLPVGSKILGLDEHTALIIDFAKKEAVVEGIGLVTLKAEGSEQRFGRGEKLPLERLQHQRPQEAAGREPERAVAGKNAQLEGPFLLKQLGEQDEAAKRALDAKDPVLLSATLLEAERIVWEAGAKDERSELVLRGRALFRDMIARSGTAFKKEAPELPGVLKALVGKLLALREDYRRQKLWAEADQIRDLLKEAGVLVDDTQDGPFWRVL